MRNMIQRKRAVVVGIVVLGIVSLLTGAIVTSAVAESENVTVSSVTTSPDTPAPGETFQVTTTIQNLEGGNGSVEITDVYIRDSTGLPEYERVEDVGSIGDGQSMDVRLQLSLDQSKNLRVHVRGRTDAGELVKVSYPLYVDVEEVDDVQLSITDGEAIVGKETPTTVTVVNGGSQAISNVELRLGSDSATVTDARRVSAAIGTTDERKYGYSVTFDEPGTHTLEAELSYTTGDGYERTIRESAMVDVDPLEDDTALSARTETRGGENVLVTTLTNFGNLPLQDVQIGVKAEGNVIDRNASPDIEPYTSSVVELDVSGVSSEAGEVVASYQIGETEQTVTRPVAFESEPEADIVLTGVEVRRSGNALTLRGDASNVGESAANGVLVSVVPDTGVTPISPSKKYFVGGVDASEFGTFELTAQTTENVSSVPVSIEYIDDGERVSRIVDLDIDNGAALAETDGQATADSAQQEGRGPFSMLNEIPWAPIGIGLLGTIVLLGGGYLWRRNGQ